MTKRTSNLDDVTVEVNGSSPVPLNSAQGVAIVEGVIQAAVAESNGESDKQSKYVQRVMKANQRLHKFQYKVAEAEADVERAKGVLKKAIGDRDGAVVELQKVIEGQQQLPGMEDAGDPTEQQAPGTADNWPISELGSKQLAKIVPDAVFESYKSRSEPIGLSASQLEKFEGAEIATIADLEKFMVDKRDWWEILAKRQDADIVRRVVDSLAEFRRVHPQGEEPTKPPTVLESLAESTQAATAEPIEPEPAAVA